MCVCVSVEATFGGDAALELCGQGLLDHRPPADVGQHQHPAPVTVSKSTLCRQGAVGTRWGAVGLGPAIGQHAERGVEQRCNGLVAVEAVRGQDDPEPAALLWKHLRRRGRRLQPPPTRLA